MKKIIMLAAIIVASTALYAAPDKKKKKAAAEAANKPQPTVLTSASDTLSYAAGMSLTRGLIDYLIGEYKVDTAYIADVAAGFRDATSKDSSDPKANAYTAGTQVAQMVLTRMLPNVEKQFEGSEHTIDHKKFFEGFVSALLGDTTVMTIDKGTRTFNIMRQADEARVKAIWKARNEQWLKDNAQKEGVKTTASGLQYKVLTEGTGAKPEKTSTVTVKYKGSLIDGTEFDSSYKRKPQTTEFRADHVIKGWTEALTMMPEGSKWELYIPQELGYGDRQMGPTIKPYSTLVFTVELVKVNKEEEKAADAKTADATKTTDTAKTADRAATVKKTPAKKAPIKRTITKKAK